MEIIAKIEAAVYTFGRDTLAGGNCGMFALALSKCLLKDGIACTINILFKNKFIEGEVLTLRSIIDSETDIYHIVVQVEKNIYDSNGKTNTKCLQEMAKDQYGDEDPLYLIGISPKDPDLLQLVSTETAWTIPSEKFHKTMHRHPIHLPIEESHERKGGLTKKIS